MIKKILMGIIIPVIIIIAVLSTASFTAPDISPVLYYFEAEFNIEINEDYTGESVPDGFDLNISGMTDGNILYIDLNENFKIFLDLLTATDVIGIAEKNLLDRFLEYNAGAVLCIDPNDLDKYTQAGEDKFTLKSRYDFSGPVRDHNFVRIFYYEDIRAKTDKELAKLPGYRYSELYMILETNEDGESFINILATRENGERKLLDPMKTDSDLSRAHLDSSAVFGEDILPMRYILELLGETVDWDAENRRAYIIKDWQNIYFEGSLINSRTYISVMQIMTKTDYMIVTAEAGEYIEIIIARKRN